MNNHPSELWRWSATDLAAAIRERSVSSREVVLSCLARIEAVNPQVNAVVSVQGDEALLAADAADRALANGDELGPLHGIPVTTKVNVDQKGLPTTNGVVAFANNIAPSDNPVIRNLRKAGAIIIGRTNTPALSMRWYTENDLHGRTLNPWCAERTPGGSSGGAAVSVATGMCPIAHATDAGGSIRYPAYCTGTVGLRPTWGRVPSFNESGSERPISIQLVAVQGAITRTVADARLSLSAISVGDPRDPWWVPVPLEGPKLPQPLHIAVCVDPSGVGVSSAVESHVRKAAAMLQEAGYDVDAVDPPNVGAAAQAWNDFVIGESIATASSLFAEHVDARAKRAFELMSLRTPRNDLSAHIKAASSRATYIRSWQLFMERYPLILSPVAMEVALPYGVDIESSASVDRLYRSNTLLFATSLLGFPSISVPTGVVDGVPMGVQIIGPRFREDLVLAAAQCIEDRCGNFTPIDPLEALQSKRTPLLASR